MSRPLDGDVRRRADVWVRRLYTSPDGRDLVAMDGRRRLFTGQLRHALILRDQSCRMPWCDAPLRDLDHLSPYRRGGPTGWANGAGLCQLHNLAKDEPAWLAAGELTPDGTHVVSVTTPTGHGHSSTSPPLLGPGADQTKEDDDWSWPADWLPRDRGEPVKDSGVEPEKGDRMSA